MKYIVILVVLVLVAGCVSVPREGTTVEPADVADNIEFVADAATSTYLFASEADADEAEALRYVAWSVATTLENLEGSVTYDKLRPMIEMAVLEIVDADEVFLVLTLADLASHFVLGTIEAEFDVIPDDVRLYALAALRGLESAADAYLRIHGARGEART